ncbi:Uma2 family endonuclease [Methylicorpusculum sp.]|uniref:Uma2 family endonuclease n=1 Tax=Methylicorpusculum sp. TaxID=2713644 RepID=UPI00272F1BC1|nr:Uma2 family endonuclease [Methylicorpusculum sp.]MDP2180441.1 Uma2 family endonuclease [Methylicorpusculum sp.]MDP3530841.1 Uma2 family endonuclease [Methylicorpusculum sp.]MDZ4152518.1 Uma2 family endonuclease [Methylicorpusculum sp.]
MSAQIQLNDNPISEQEYLDGEKLSEIKHEYIDGDVYAMAGASKNHERIAGNVFGELRSFLKGKPCEPFASDVKIKAGSRFFYPDVMVVCDDATPNEYYTESPVIIVEVVSKSTRRIDETVKRTTYQTIPSLKELVLIEQDFVDVEVCRKSEGWISNHYFMGDEVTFESLGLTLAVEEIYTRVDNEDVRTFLEERALREQEAAQLNVEEG